MEEERTLEMREEDKEKELCRKERFSKIGIAGVIYTLFYTFCLYRNASGITSPFFVTGTLYFYYYCIKKSEVPAKKGSRFYVVAVLLLGLSNFLTDNGFFIAVNHMGILVLNACFLLHQYCEDSSWGLETYLKALVKTAFGTIANFLSLIIDGFAFIKLREKNKNSKMEYVWIGIGIGIPLFLFVLILLSSADRMFEYLFMRGILVWWNQLRLWDHIFSLAWTLLLGMGTGYGLLVFLEKRKLPAEKKKELTGEPIVGNIVVGMLATIYVFFCGVQLVGLFGGMAVLPEDYTYAEYAREGFFQLLFVCMLNLGLVLFCLGYFRKSRVLRGLLTVVSVCTYVMIASSAYRMILYIRSYDLTLLRVLVLWMLFVVALSLVGVLVRLYQDEFPLFRYLMVAGTVCYLTLSLIRPDFWIAWYNVKYSNQCDWYYLSELSADAAPILYRYRPVEFRELCASDVTQEADIRKFNASRYLVEILQK